MRKIKIGLVGCGRIAHYFHLDILTNLDNVTLAAIAEKDDQQRKATLAKIGSVPAFRDYLELLKIQEIEAVVICLPTNLHKAAALAALAANKHVYLEKPLATNALGAKKVAEAFQKKGKIGMMGFNNRFNPLYKKAKGHLKNGTIGSLVGGRLVLCSAKRSLPIWKQKRATGGGVLLDLATHMIDLIHFLLEEKILSVSAEISSFFTEDDTASINMGLENGLLFQGFFSLSSIQENKIELFGDKGKMVVDRRKSTINFIPPKQRYGYLGQFKDGLNFLTINSRTFSKIIFPPKEISYENALSAFVAAIHQAQAVDVNFMDGYRSAFIIEAAEKSAQSGQKINIPSSIYEDIIT